MTNDVSQERKKVMMGALISGVLNAIINGTIQWYLLKDQVELVLTVDGITNDEHTVLGAAVPLAVSLAIILTLVAYTGFKKPRPSFFPTYLGLALKHGFFALGVVITFAVLWQRMLGSVSVSLTTAVIVLGLIAGIVSAIIDYMTITASKAN